jgi:hypothetical protein
MFVQISYMIRDFQKKIGDEKIILMPSRKKLCRFVTSQTGIGNGQEKIGFTD